jgi:kynureninase
VTKSPIKEALAIATPLANGLAELVGATDSRLVLGVHDSWSNNPAQLLRAGYVAVILAEDDHFKDGGFFVVKNRLQYGETIDSSKPLTGRD